MALYAEIVEIIAPSEALAGSTVNIQVKIKNKHSSAIGIMARGALDYGVSPWPTINFPDNWDNVAAGATKTFYGSFTMPNSDVKIHAYSYWYGIDEYGYGSWYFDDEATKDISLTELAPSISQFSIVDYIKV